MSSSACSRSGGRDFGLELAQRTPFLLLEMADSKEPYPDFLFMGKHA